MSFRRIGCRTHFNDAMLDFFENRPFVWGGAINGFDWHGIPYLNNLQRVNAGDILVAGGVLNIDFIGKIKSKPKFIPSNLNRRDKMFYKVYGIDAENDTNIIASANRLDLEDMVCIETAWYDIKKRLRFPHRQQQGGFQMITNQDNLKYISKIIGMPLNT